MTAWSSIEVAVEAMRRGARDFVQKPWENSRLLNILRTQVEMGRARRKRERLEAEQQMLSRKLEEELKEAREIQQGLLPKIMPRLRGFEIADAWKPARAVGGDYFDVRTFSERYTALCIADVAGKGMPAALLMSKARASANFSGMKPGSAATAFS